MTDKQQTSTTGKSDTSKTDKIKIITDHVYRGPHHGKDGVSDFRVLAIGVGDDHQGKRHTKCVTVETTDAPHGKMSFGMEEFLGWVVTDVTGEYERIPKTREGKTGKTATTKGNGKVKKS